jgi:hypothetical protein
MLAEPGPDGVAQPCVGVEFVDGPEQRGLPGDQAGS